MPKWGATRGRRGRTGGEARGPEAQARAEVVIPDEHQVDRLYRHDFSSDSECADAIVDAFDRLGDCLELVLEPTQHEHVLIDGQGDRTLRALDSDRVPLLRKRSLSSCSYEEVLDSLIRRRCRLDHVLREILNDQIDCRVELSLVSWYEQVVVIRIPRIR
mgnify:CR=1 FL=1